MLDDFLTFSSMQTDSVRRPLVASERRDWERAVGLRECHSQCPLDCRCRRLEIWCLPPRLQVADVTNQVSAALVSPAQKRISRLTH